MQESEQATPLELVATFQRCVNYPKDDLGLIALAQGLARASRITGTAMDAIVTHCAEVSSYCPTDADLLNVARELREQAQREEQACHNQLLEWEREYGPPKRFDLGAYDAESTARAWARDRKMNADIREELQLKNGKLPNGQHPTWLMMADAAEKLGYHAHARAWRTAVGR